MRMRRGLASVAAAAVLAISVAGAAGAASAIPPPGPLTLTPSQGPGGTTFTASQAISPISARSVCPEWFAILDGTIQSGTDTNFTSPTRSATLQIPPDALPGAHSVISYCTDVNGATTEVGGAAFLVPTPPTTTTSTTTTTTTTIATTTTATTTTTVPTTTTAKATTTTAKAATTTAKATTTTAGSTTTATTTPSTTTSTTTTTTPSTTSTAPTRAVEVRALALDKPSVPPGGDVKATGEGCDPDATVTLEIDGKQVGETTADEDGSFSTPIAVPDVDPGRLEVQAHCGPVLTTDLDVVLASSVSGGTSILLVITCSVIVLFALLWYGLRSSRG